MALIAAVVVFMITSFFTFGSMMLVTKSCKKLLKLSMEDSMTDTGVDDVNFRIDFTIALIESTAACSHIAAGTFCSDVSVALTSRI